MIGYRGQYQELFLKAFAKTECIFTGLMQAEQKYQNLYQLFSRPDIVHLVVLFHL